MAKAKKELPKEGTLGLGALFGGSTGLVLGFIFGPTGVVGAVIGSFFGAGIGLALASIFSSKTTEVKRKSLPKETELVYPGETSSQDDKKEPEPTFHYESVIKTTPDFKKTDYDEPPKKQENSNRPG